MASQSNSIWDRAEECKHIVRLVGSFVIVVEFPHSYNAVLFKIIQNFFEAVSHELWSPQLPVGEVGGPGDVNFDGYL